jgi:hypothetical protein
MYLISKLSNIGLALYSVFWSSFPHQRSFILPKSKFSTNFQHQFSLGLHHSAEASGPPKYFIPNAKDVCITIATHPAEIEMRKEIANERAM